MKRNLVIALLLTLLVVVVQLIARQSALTVLISGVIAFLISLFVLAISDRYGRRG